MPALPERTQDLVTKNYFITYRPTPTLQLTFTDLRDYIKHKQFFQRTIHQNIHQNILNIIYLLYFTLLRRHGRLFYSVGKEIVGNCELFLDKIFFFGHEISRLIHFTKLYLDTDKIIIKPNESVNKFSC